MITMVMRKKKIKLMHQLLIRIKMKAMRKRLKEENKRNLPRELKSRLTIISSKIEMMALVATEAEVVTIEETTTEEITIEATEVVTIITTEVAIEVVTKVEVAMINHIDKETTDIKRINHQLMMVTLIMQRVVSIK